MSEQTVLCEILRGWRVQQYDNYLRVDIDGSPGFITIKQEGEGLVVDLWSDDEEVAASTYAFYSELEREGDES